MIPLVPGSIERLRGEIRTRSAGLLLAGGVGSRIFRSRMPSRTGIQGSASAPKYSTSGTPGIAPMCLLEEWAG